jgi:hypothetical protein
MNGFLLFFVGRCISQKLEISELDLHVTKVEEGLQWMEVIIVTMELDEEVPKGEDSNNCVHKNGDDVGM